MEHHLSGNSDLTDENQGGEKEASWLKVQLLIPKASPSKSSWNLGS